MTIERTRSIIKPDAVERGIERNSVHGSDAPETARTEIASFFRATEQHAYEWKR
jgi:nucleoside diphosphate kinase